MITIQCTKKLASESKLALIDVKQIESQPLYCWHSHFFLFKRQKCVLVMNNETRYNFVIYGLKKADFKRFDEIILENITKNLLADGIEQALIDNNLRGHKQVIYTPTSNRSRNLSNGRVLSVNFK